MIKIGVLGCAQIANRSVIPAILELKSVFELIGIASRDPQKGLTFAEKFHSQAYDYSSLVTDKKIDAVYIPLPNALHSYWIKKALENNKHVLVEKSMTMSLEDSTELNDMARMRNLVLIENFQFRFHRQLAVVQELVGNGAVGTLRGLRSSFGFPPFPDASNIRYNNNLGGGALYDAGAYPIKVAQLLLGNNLDVTAAKLFFDQEKGVDLWGGGFLEQTDGPLFAAVGFGFDQYYQCNIEIWGSKGKLTAPRIFTAAPGFETEIILENAGGIEKIAAGADNHFKNMLLYFSNLIKQPNIASQEYADNINQSRLLEKFKTLANAK